MKRSLLLFIDTETTGLDPKVNAILQVAWVLESLPEREIVDFDNFYIDISGSFWKNACRNALEANGLSREMLHGKKKFNGVSVLLPAKAKHVLGKLFEKIAQHDTSRNDKYWIGKNPKFDLDFIDEFLGLWPTTGFGHAGNIFNHRLIDINSYLAPLVINDTIKDFNFSNIQLPVEEHHSAMSDVTNNRYVFWNFFYAINSSIFALTPREGLNQRFDETIGEYKGGLI